MLTRVDLKRVSPVTPQKSEVTLGTSRPEASEKPPCSASKSQVTELRASGAVRLPTSTRRKGTSYTCDWQSPKKSAGQPPTPEFALSRGDGTGAALRGLCLAAETPFCCAGFEVALAEPSLAPAPGRNRASSRRPCKPGFMSRQIYASVQEGRPRLATKAKDSARMGAAWQSM
jgi:hypothetical protein